MSRSLNMKDINIVEEYFSNGFNKSKAFEKYNPKSNYKTIGAFYNSASAFFRRENIKELITERREFIIGEREELIDELLIKLKENVFCRETDEFYTHSNRQKDIELLMKISGINQAPKFKDEVKATEEVITINLLDD